MKYISFIFFSLSFTHAINIKNADNGQTRSEVVGGAINVNLDPGNAKGGPKKYIWSAPKSSDYTIIRVKNSVTAASGSGYGDFAVEKAGTATITSTKTCNKEIKNPCNDAPVQFKVTINVS